MPPEALSTRLSSFLIPADILNHMGPRSLILNLLLIVAVLIAPLRIGMLPTHVHSDRARERHAAGVVHTHTHWHDGVMHIHTHSHPLVDDGCDGEFPDHHGDLTTMTDEPPACRTSTRRFEFDPPSSVPALTGPTLHARGSCGPAGRIVPPPRLRGVSEAQCTLRTTILRL